MHDFKGKWLPVKMHGISEKSSQILKSFKNCSVKCEYKLMNEVKLDRLYRQRPMGRKFTLSNSLKPAGTFALITCYSDEPLMLR